MRVANVSLGILETHIINVSTRSYLRVPSQLAHSALSFGFRWQTLIFDKKKVAKTEEEELVVL